MISLTEREREVAIMIATGSSCKEVSAAFNLSIKTIEAHRYNLYKKAKVRSAIGLCFWAMKKGFIPVPAVECEEVEKASALLAAIDTVIAELNQKRAELSKAATEIRRYVL